MRPAAWPGMLPGESTFGTEIMGGHAMLVDGPAFLRQDGAVGCGGTGPGHER
jgi:hypothetical protein